MVITNELLMTRAHENAEDCEYLDLSKLGIGKLEKLEQFVSLRTLNLHLNNLYFISNLEQCSNLWHINLSDNNVENIAGFEMFLALGKLDLSDNNLPWYQLIHIHHIAIIDLTLAGNKQLTSAEFYRSHVIDCLPNIWMLDGRLVTYTERLNVEQFFETSELQLHPVRHKLPRTKFQTTEMNHRAVLGTFGQKARDLLLHFPIHLKGNHEIDDRRFAYMVDNVQQDLLLESHFQSKPYHLLEQCPCFITDLLDVHKSDTETFNTVTLLVMASLLFRIPHSLLHDFILRSSLSSLTNIVSVNDLLQLPRCALQTVASVLFSVLKLHRDNKQLDNGLHDMIYLAFYFSFDEVCYNKKNPATTSRTLQIVKRLIAMEIVQLLTICPSFFTAIGKHRDLTQLLRLATCEKAVQSIARLFEEQVMEDQTVQAHCLLAAELLNGELSKRAHDYYCCCSPIDSQQLFVLMTKDAFPKRRQHWPVYASQYHTRGVSSPARRTSRKAMATKVSPKPHLGDRILFGPQLTGNIIAIPETDIVLVQTLRVVTSSGAVIVNYRQLAEHYSYHNINKFYWDCQRRMWRPCGTVGDSVTFKFVQKPTILEQTSDDQDLRNSSVVHKKLCPLPDCCTLVQTSLFSVAEAFLSTHDLKLSFDVFTNWITWPNTISVNRPYFDFRQLLEKRKEPVCEGGKQQVKVSRHLDVISSGQQLFDVPVVNRKLGQSTDMTEETKSWPGQECALLNNTSADNTIASGTVPLPAEPDTTVTSGHEANITSDSSTGLLDVMPNIQTLMADNDALTRQRQRLTFWSPSPFGNAQRVGITHSQTGDVYCTQYVKSPCVKQQVTEPELACRNQSRQQHQTILKTSLRAPVSASLKRAPTLGLLTTLSS